MVTSHIRFATFLVALLALTPRGYAIGLDELKPQVDKPEDETIDETAPDLGAGKTKEGIAIPPADTMPVKKTPHVINPDATLTPGQKTKAAEPVKPPSELSLKLAEKMYLATGLGYATLKGPKGDWTTLGNADALIAYQISDSATKPTRWFASYRFAPYDVVVTKDTESYRGNIDTHAFGAILRHKQNGIDLHAEAEAIVQMVHLKQSEDFKPKENLEKNGFAVGIGGGVDWRMLEKLTLGPRVNVAAGTFLSAQVLCNLGFVF